MVIEKIDRDALEYILRKMKPESARIIIKKYPEVSSMIFRNLKDLYKLRNILKGARVADISFMNSIDIFSELSHNQKKEVLVKSGYSEKEIEKLVPNRDRTKKEKGFSKKVIGENILGLAMHKLVDDIRG